VSRDRNWDQDLEWLKLEAARVLPLINEATGFVAVALDNVEARKIASEWHSFVTTPKPSYCLSSTGAIVPGILEELARDLKAVRDATYAFYIRDGIPTGLRDKPPYAADEERRLGSLIAYCAARIEKGDIRPVKGWHDLRW
jgi:hypothetical protein